MEIKLDEKDYDAISDKLVERLKPFLVQKEIYDDVILDVSGVANLLSKGKGQIYQWVDNSRHGMGEFPYMKAGKSLRFSKNEILQWMKQHGNN